MVDSPRRNAREYRIAPVAFNAADLGRILDLQGAEAAFNAIAEWLRQVSEVLKETQRGKLNNLGTVTLTPSSATTVINDTRIGPNSVIQMTPTSATAAVQAWHQTYPNASNGTAIINHPTSAETDRSFVYTVTG